MEHFEITYLGGKSLFEQAEILEAEAIYCWEHGDEEGAEILNCEAAFIRDRIQQYEQCL